MSIGWYVGTDYKSLDGSLAIQELSYRTGSAIDNMRFRRDKNGVNQPVNLRNHISKVRWRVFPNIKYNDFHIEPDPFKLLKPVLPWELLVKQENYIVEE